jgi:hypothetical protein
VASLVSRNPSLSTATTTNHDCQFEHMKFLKKLATGQIALWCVFWLIGTPLVLLWDVSGVCTVVGCGIQESATAGFLLALFALSSIAIPFVSFAIWRSSSNYPQKTWGQTVIAWGAKFCATLSGLLAVIGLLVLLYIAAVFAYAAIDRM